MSHPDQAAIITVQLNLACEVFREDLGELMHSPATPGRSFEISYLDLATGKMKSFEIIIERKVENDPS